ncbi:hypothetical protein GEV33_002020 [Tenebrio molitor]|uniref:Uncharacterized protein n=1 Tax=Tenebrio molitor TaxID=7067 RepID=A0A8J6HS78_TENMO|nr:hypothetical protein GEV33_002020 [Tenebrio molitor]
MHRQTASCTPESRHATERIKKDDEFLSRVSRIFRTSTTQIGVSVESELNLAPVGLWGLDDGSALWNQPRINELPLFSVYLAKMKGC